MNNNKTIFLKENICEDVLWKMTAIVFCPPCVNQVRAFRRDALLWWFLPENEVLTDALWCEFRLRQLDFIYQSRTLKVIKKAAILQTCGLEEMFERCWYGCFPQRKMKPSLQCFCCFWYLKWDRSKFHCIFIIEIVLSNTRNNREFIIRYCNTWVCLKLISEEGIFKTFPRDTLSDF